MSKEFIVCREEDLYETIKIENKKHKNKPHIYMAGYTKFSRWVYEDYTPDCDYNNEKYYCIDYSDDGEDVLWDKFFNYKVTEILNSENFEELKVNKERYSIDVFFDEWAYYNLDAFWHTAELSEGEIEWLNDQEN